MLCRVILELISFNYSFIVSIQSSIWFISLHLELSSYPHLISRRPLAYTVSSILFSSLFRHRISISAFGPCPRLISTAVGDGLGRQLLRLSGERRVNATIVTLPFLRLRDVNLNWVHVNYCHITDLKSCTTQTKPSSTLSFSYKVHKLQPPEKARIG